jgi:hypothetical protein
MSYAEMRRFAEWFQKVFKRFSIMPDVLTSLCF